MGQEIVPIGGGITVGDAMRRIGDIVDAVVDMDSAEQANDELDDILHRMMKNAELYGEIACYACYCEAKLLFEVADMGVTPSFRRPMIEWLAERTDDERASILATCSQGVRVSLVKARWTREANKSRRDDEQIKEHKRLRQKLLDDLHTTGRTNLSFETYVRQWSLPEPPDLETYHAFREVTKIDALRSGAVGIGDGSNEYILPEVGRQDENRKALETRLRGVDSDLRSIIELCERANLRMPRSAADSLNELVRRIAALIESAVTD